MKRECGLPDVFEYQHVHVGDTSIKSVIKEITSWCHKTYYLQWCDLGFSPWGAAMASDHRTGIVDLHVDTLFGDVEENTHRSSRNLHTSYPESKKYLAEELEQFNQRNILTSMNKLKKYARHARHMDYKKANQI